MDPHVTLNVTLKVRICHSSSITVAVVSIIRCTTCCHSNKLSKLSLMATASDIITYIGVPLAVLGVLPIFYTFINSFFTLRNVKRSLRRCGLEATTRGSFVTGFVEVSLPRFLITPLERTEDEFWTDNTRPSTLKGGTWTIFHWKRLVTGHAMQRVQYSSDLRVPQAEGICGPAASSYLPITVY